MDKRIVCRTINGEEKQINQTDLVFRPSVYGLVVHEGRVLMTNTRSTGKLSAPGGALELGETLEAALKREMREECGIEIEVLTYAFFKEAFFYYEPLNGAWQCFMFFFLCKPLSLDITDAQNESGDESELPRWVDIATLQEDDIQVCGKEIMKFLTAKQEKDGDGVFLKK